MIGGGFLGGGISIVPAGKAIIYASLTTEDGGNIPNAVFKATRTGSTVTVNGSIDGRAELLVDAGHTYTVTVTPAGGSYLNNSQTVATASAKSYTVKFYLYPSKANEASTTASLNALNTSISTHSSNKSNPHNVTKAQVGLGAYPTSPADIGISTATQTELDALDTSISTHSSNRANPHGVTKAQVGLGNVNNTSDMAKPVSTAQKAALDGKAEKESTEAHINNKSNPHAVTKAQIGLGNVNNTSDLGKPVSTATNTELAKKVAIAQGSVNASKFALTDASGNLNTFRTLTATDIPNLNASKINDGVLATARLPNLDANKITSGTFNVDRIPQLAMGRVDGLSGALDAKEDKLTFDSAPIQDSDNPVKSGGIYGSLTELENRLKGYLYRLITPLMPAVDCAELLTMYKGDTTLTETPLINATGCTSLKEVFKGCTNLKTVKYIHTPNVANMADMFRYCSSLTTIAELDTSNVDNMYAVFFKCSSLTTAPPLNMDGVTNSNSMFGECSSLTSVTFTGDVVPPYGSYMFYKTPIASGNGYIFVPDSLVQAYKTASGWSTHASVIYGHSDKENMV